MKPTTFFNLPYMLQKSLLWDIDLVYDSYESSKAETIHGIMNEQISSINRGCINFAYYHMAEEMLLGRARCLRDEAVEETESLNKLISRLL